MKNLYTLLLFLLLGTVVSNGQDVSDASAGIDIGSAFGNNSWAPSALYHEEFGLRKLPWLQAGVGIRGWGYYAGRTDLFLQNSAPKDTLKYWNVSANGIAFVVGLNVKIWKIDLGVNTDITGFAVGSKRSGYYPKNSSSNGEGKPYYNKWIATSPVVFNTLPLFFSKYSGQSEAYLRFWVSRKIGVKLGYLQSRIAYVTRNQDGQRVLLDSGQRRFSNLYGMPFAALTFPLFE